MQKVKIIYFGTPDFSARLLQKIVEDKELPVEIMGVVTQPDKKAGRRQIMTPTPVNELAKRLNLPVATDQASAMEMLKKADLGLLFAYGEILSKDLLDSPKYGFWNVHPSLLPKYRGPSPVAQALIDGAVETGVTIMQMDEKLDHGPILAQQNVYIFPVWRHDQLLEHLVDRGDELIKQLLQHYQDDPSQAPKIEQDHKQATFTHLFKKEDGFIEASALMSRVKANDKTLFDLYRGLYPWPGIWTLLRLKTSEEQADKFIEKRLKITKIHWEDGQIILKKVQLEGKNEVDFEIFTRAYPDVLAL